MRNNVKTAFFMFSLFILVSVGNSAKSQKAYDIITYKAIIYGNPATLQLASGYLLASKVTVTSKLGNQVFSPATDEPDAKGDLRFDAVKGTGRYKSNKGSWLTLKKLDGQEYPTRIKAIYWDGKIPKNIIFKQR